MMKACKSCANYALLNTVYDLMNDIEFCSDYSFLLDFTVLHTYFKN